LDPNNPEDYRVIINYLLEEELEEWDLEEVLVLLQNSKLQNDSGKTTRFDVGSEEELNYLLTNFHFSQQIIFDFYEINES
jgi:hypothetical protein